MEYDTCTVTIYFDVNDGDVLSNDISGVETKNLPRIKELLQKLSWAYNIDADEEDWSKVINRIYNSAEQIELATLLWLWDELSYYDLFSCIDNEYPHTFEWATVSFWHFDLLTHTFNS